MKRKTIANDCRHAIASLKRSVNNDYSNCFHILHIGEVDLDCTTLEKLHEFTELYLYCHVISSLDRAERTLLNTSEVLTPRRAINYALYRMNELIDSLPALFGNEHPRFIADERTIEIVHKRLVRYYQSWSMPSILEANNLINLK